MPIILSDLLQCVVETRHDLFFFHFSPQPTAGNLWHFPVRLNDSRKANLIKGRIPPQG
jgi:hypothetical protein